MELYQRWHDKLFPHCDFAVFVEKCETLGKKREIQTCLSTLRNKFVHGLDPYADCVGDDIPPAADEPQVRPASICGWLSHVLSSRY
jgi:hypothetical protein